MMKRFQKFALIKEYLQKKTAEVDQYNRENNIDTSLYVNGRRLTNIGTFRAYIDAYLHHHPKVHDNMTFLIRQLDPTENGLPLQIYVFSNDQAWANYEAIQADIFDHLLAVIPEFELKAFQRPAGRDFHALSQGKVS
jgi:miniconductance mechanosensitive channel